MVNSSTISLRNSTTRKTYRVFLLLITVLLVLGALLLPLALRPEALPLTVGDVATKDILAPYTDSFSSPVQTEKARLEAEASVPEVYLPSDPMINRAQIEKLQAITSFITSIRTDNFATSEQKGIDLTSIANVTLSQEQAAAILQLNNEQWESIQSESINVLDQIMRRTIRPAQVSEIVTTIPGLINYTLPATHYGIITSLVAPLVSANSLYSEEQTRILREEAAAKVEPVIRAYTKNQAIVLRGQIITPEQYEVLQHYDLVRSSQKFHDIISTLSIVVMLAGYIVLYFSRRRISALTDLRNITVISFVFLIFLYASRILIPNRTIVPYFFPLPAFALILATLFNLEISITLSLVLAILASFGVNSSADLLVFYIATSLLGALALGKGKKAIHFLWAGIAIAAAGILVLAAFRLASANTDFVGLMTLFGATFLNGFASASLALLFQYLLSQLIGLPTPMYLIELSRSDHPLLKFILQSAPGTYQHSLQVSNLAEQAAESIGADSLLVRVGTLFHDAGKAMNPTFFVENQVPGAINAHDNMDPIIAAQTIIQHIPDGIKLAEKYRLPPRLQDFIREHHGNQITRYQYNRALQLQNNDPEKVDLELFRYPGPKPQTKETGILMLADGCEARARAELPKTEEDLRSLVKKVFDSILSNGLLENTNLTLHDMKIIQESFVTTLSNTYHPRLQYPEVKTGEELGKSNQ